MVVNNALLLRTFQIGSTRHRDEGLRIAVTRRPPRGVPKSEWGSHGRFDVWFPVLAPSQVLLRRTKKANLEDARTRAAFFAAYEKELNRPEARHIVGLIAAIARHTPIAVGCYCDDERRCHRSVLKRVIEESRTSL